MDTKQLQYDVYEVFIQRTQAEHHVHVGSLVAPSADIAIQTARENFLRRDKAVNIWVVSRGQITATPYEADYFTREMDRNYREVSGYTENGRLWRMFKEKALSLEEIVQYVEGRKYNSAEERSKRGIAYESE